MLNVFVYGKYIYIWLTLGNIVTPIDTFFDYEGAQYDLLDLFLKKISIDTLR